MIVFILYEENFCPYLLRREFLFLLKIVFFKKNLYSNKIKLYICIIRFVRCLC
jgi:hypothetical protein